jgi:hypothetical protein
MFKPLELAKTDITTVMAEGDAPPPREEMP